MPAPLAYSMFKVKTNYPLHTAIRTQREDVVFLYLVEHDSQVNYLLSVLCVSISRKTLKTLLMELRLSSFDTLRANSSLFSISLQY